MQGTRLDLVVVGDQRPEPGHVLDAAEQVRVGGVVLRFDRRADAAVTVADHDIDVVAAEELFLVDGHRIGLGVRAAPELVEVFQHIGLQLLEPVEHTRQFGAVTAQVVDQGGDGRLAHVTAEILDAAALGLLQLLHLTDHLLQAFLQRLHAGLDAGLLFGGQLRELFVGHHLPVHHRGQREPHRRLDECDLLGRRVGTERLERLVLLLGDLGVDLLGTIAVLVALEQGCDGRPRVFLESADFVAEADTHPVRQPQRPGAVLLGEVLHIHPVVGQPLGICAGPDEVQDQGVLADPWRAEHEDVVAGGPQADAELDCVACAFLTGYADVGAQTGQVGRGGEPHGLESAGCAERLRSQRRDGSHVQFSSRPRPITRVAPVNRPPGDTEGWATVVSRETRWASRPQSCTGVAAANR